MPENTSSSIWPKVCSMYTTVCRGLARWLVRGQGKAAGDWIREREKQRSTTHLGSHPELSSNIPWKCLSAFSEPIEILDSRGHPGSPPQLELCLSKKLDLNSRSILKDTVWLWVNPFSSLGFCFFHQHWGTEEKWSPETFSALKSRHLSFHISLQPCELQQYRLQPNTPRMLLISAESTIRKYFIWILPTCWLLRICRAEDLGCVCK